MNTKTRRRLWIVAGTVAGALAIATAAFAAVLLVTQHVAGTVTSDPRPTVTLASVTPSNLSNSGMTCTGAPDGTDLRITVRGYGGDSCVLTARLTTANPATLALGAIIPTGVGAETLTNVNLIAANGPTGVSSYDLAFTVTVPATAGVTTLDVQFPFQLNDGR